MAGEVDVTELGRRFHTNNAPLRGKECRMGNLIAIDYLGEHDDFELSDAEPSVDTNDTR